MGFKWAANHRFLLLNPHITKLEGGGGVHLFLSIHQSVHPSSMPWPLSIKPTVLDGFHPYWAQMKTINREYVVHNDHWPSLIYSSFLSHDFALRHIFKVPQPPWVCNKSAKIWHIRLFPLYSTYILGLILFIFGQNHHQYDKVCRGKWPLNLTYIFKVIQPWLCNKFAKIWHIVSCALCILYRSGWILSLFGINNCYYERGCR